MYNRKKCHNIYQRDLTDTERNTSTQRGEGISQLDERMKLALMMSRHDLELLMEMGKELPSRKKEPSIRGSCYFIES